MNCQIAQESIFQWLDDESRQAELHSHCQNCAECRAIAEAFSSLDMVLSPEEPDAQLPQRLRQGLQVRLASLPTPIGVRLRRWWETLRSQDNPVKALLRQRPLAYRGYALAGAVALYVTPSLYFSYADPQTGSFFLAFSLLLSALLIPLYLVACNLRLVLSLQRGRCIEEIVSAGIAPANIVDTLTWHPLIRSAPLLLLSQLLLLPATLLLPQTTSGLAWATGCLELTLLLALQYFALGWVSCLGKLPKAKGLLGLSGALMSAALVGWAGPTGVALLLPLAYCLAKLRRWSIERVADYLNRPSGQPHAARATGRRPDENPIVHRYGRDPRRPILAALGLGSLLTWLSAPLLMGMGRLDPLAGYALGLALVALALLFWSGLRILRSVSQERQGSTWESLVCTPLSAADYGQGWRRISRSHSLIWLAAILPSVWLLTKALPFHSASLVGGLGLLSVSLTLLGAARLGTDLGVHLALSRQPDHSNDLPRWIFQCLALLAAFACCQLLLSRVGESLAIFSRNSGRGGDFMIAYRTFAPAAITLASLWLTLLYRWLSVPAVPPASLLSLYTAEPRAPWYFDTLVLGLGGALAGAVILLATEKTQHIDFFDLFATLALGCLPLAQWGIWLVSPWKDWLFSRSFPGFLLRAAWLAGLLILPQWVLARAVGYPGLLYLAGLWLNPVAFHFPQRFTAVVLTCLATALLLALAPSYWLARKPSFKSSGHPLWKAGMTAAVALLLLKWGLPYRYRAVDAAASQAIHNQAQLYYKTWATFLPEAPTAPADLDSLVKPPGGGRQITGPIGDDAEGYKQLLRLDARWSMSDSQRLAIKEAASSLPALGRLNYQQCNRWMRALWISAIGARSQPQRALDFLEILSRLEAYADHDELFHSPMLLEQLAVECKETGDRERLQHLLESWKNDTDGWKHHLQVEYLAIHNGPLEGLLPDFIIAYRCAERLKFLEGQPTRDDLDLGFLSGPGAAGSKLRKYWRARCDLELAEVRLALERAKGPAGYPPEMPQPTWNTRRTWTYRSWGSGYEVKVSAPTAPLWTRNCGPDDAFWDREVRYQP